MPSSIGAVSDGADVEDGTLKLYLPKSASVNEGDHVVLSPTRYLVYQGDAPPFEMRQPAPARDSIALPN